MAKLVVIESPYRGKGYTNLVVNIRYARACMRDCFLRGEVPYASHLLYTQGGVLDDTNPEERELGIQGGFAWSDKADLTAAYIDLIDDWEHFVGIVRGVARAMKIGRLVEVRSLSADVLRGVDSGILERRGCLRRLEKELFERARDFRE